MRREYRERFSCHRRLTIPTCITARAWRQARAVMHAGIAKNSGLKSVAGKTFPAFPAHAQTTILRIWYEAHVHLKKNPCN